MGGGVRGRGGVGWEGGKRFGVGEERERRRMAGAWLGGWVGERLGGWERVWVWVGARG